MGSSSIQRILTQHLPDIIGAVGLPLYQLKALNQLKSCRTAALGGHAQYCEQGHLNGVWYNSCKHRACPQCGSLAREQWLKNIQSRLLNCPHHHIVFTIPSELNGLWRYNRSLLSGLLFQAVQHTLKDFSSDARYLSATPGFLSALHTWGRNLSLHPHLHVLISHGGINAEGQWVVPKKSQLFPQKPVMMVFRGKLLSKLKAVLKSKKLQCPPNETPHQLNTLFNRLGRKLLGSTLLSAL